MQRIAVGPDGADTGYTEAVMKAWKNKTWAWDIEGLSLHTYTVVKWPPAFKATGFGEDEYATILNATLNMETWSHAQRRSWTGTTREEVALVVDEWGAWLAETPGSPEGFLEQQNSQRDALVAALNINIFARHADRVRVRQYRADGQRAAGDDPHATGEDAADADVSGVPDVPAIPGCDFDPGDGFGG